ncbi:MAG: hypothetical protein E7551_08320 [Ruminococcaceae bacterium]|nr:hypothetical protein [Oscillospiraceae bacterium]
MGLFDFLKNLPTINELKGGIGEWMAKHYSKIVTDAFVLHDVLIDADDNYTSQIDLLLIGNKGIYVVEVKSFDDAKIYGDGRKLKWYYYKNGKKIEIYSPLKQNEKHIKYLKEFLKDFGDIPCFSILTVFCVDFNVSNINKIDTIMCNTLPAMERALYYIAEDKPLIFDDVKKQEIYEYIKNNQYIGKEARRKHKQNVIAYKENLESKKKQKNCPYCKTSLVLRKGKYGEFYGCSNFPKCKYVLKEK